ncbi:response regulator [Fodinibius halophilus]|uniref:Response regulator n=1 Tax=Fodinibius halophilus TaxID=1736908 RepID=A0A6M1T7F4_9BACT|nr:response regulator [Fodinibius halophilus]NGP88593.1 response regulator [Fodinibius halophilus]
MGSKSSGRILIVEDDLLLSMVEERLIQKLGYDVVGKAENGLEAIDKFSELDPDAIIMDISLDGKLDGIETVQKIREQSDVPVIYLSGSSDRYQYERAQKTGCVEFLTKPITGGDLKGPLSKALNGSTQQQPDSEEQPIATE